MNPAEKEEDLRQAIEAQGSPEDAEDYPDYNEKDHD